MQQELQAFADFPQDALANDGALSPQVEILEKFAGLADGQV